MSLKVVVGKISDMTIDDARRSAQYLVPLRMPILVQLVSYITIKFTK